MAVKQRNSKDIIIRSESELDINDWIAFFTTGIVRTPRWGQHFKTARKNSNGSLFRHTLWHSVMEIDKIDDPSRIAEDCSNVGENDTKGLLEFGAKTFNTMSVSS